MVSKGRKKVKLKPSYIFLGVLIFAVFATMAMSLYLFLQFKTGDFVYQKDTMMIGQIKGISLPLDYIVQWQNGEINKEPLFSINKLSELTELEVENILKKNNEEDYHAYPGRIEGEAIVLEDLIPAAGDTTEYLVEGFGGAGNILKLKEGDCRPKIICGKWSECQTDYDLNTLILEEMSSGVQYRQCRDYSECISNFIDSRKCEVKVEIELKRVTENGEEYIEVHDKEKNRLIARMTDVQLANLKKLNIEFMIF